MAIVSSTIAVFLIKGKSTFSKLKEKSIHIILVLKEKTFRVEAHFPTPKIGKEAF